MLGPELLRQFQAGHVAGARQTASPVRPTQVKVSLSPDAGCVQEFRRRSADSLVRVFPKVFTDHRADMAAPSRTFLASVVGCWLLQVGCWMLLGDFSMFDVQGSRFKVQGSRFNRCSCSTLNFEPEARNSIITT
jgi:hypothetical protein